MSVFSVTVYISLAHSPLLLLALTFDRDLIVDGSGLAAAPINISAQLVGLCPLAQKYGAIAVIAVMADFSCYIARCFFGTWHSGGLSMPFRFKLWARMHACRPINACILRKDVRVIYRAVLTI